MKEDKQSYRAKLYAQQTDFPSTRSILYDRKGIGNTILISPDSVVPSLNIKVQTLHTVSLVLHGLHVL